MDRFQEFWRSFRKNRAALLGLVIVVLVVLAALSAPLLYPESPFSMVTRPLTPPFTTWTYPLGTDLLGRDVASMLFHGARVSLTIAVVAMSMAMTIGITIGSCAGYYGGIVDDVLMRLTEMVQTMPSFLFALALVSIIGPSFVNVVFTIGVVAWPSLARLIRAQFLTLREREFVQACRTMGMTDRRIIFSEILPNALPPAIVLAAVIIAFSILLEAALAFLGVSDQNTASWGWMIGQGREVIQTTPWLIAIPGIAIIVTVLGVSLVGEGLNDALNPYSRRY
jgi:peptide/nickel transport system permease protein